MPYSLLVSDQVGGAKGIGLGDDGDEVNARTQPLHNFNVERLQGVSGGSDEVQASVNAHVNLVCTTGLLLLQHVRFMLVVEEFNDGLPGIAVVDIISKARGINDGQTNYTFTLVWPEETKRMITFEELLLQLRLGDFDLHSAVNLLLVTALVVGVVLDSSRKQGVDKGSLSKSRLSSNLFPPCQHRPSFAPSWSLQIPMTLSKKGNPP